MLRSLSLSLCLLAGSTSLVACASASTAENNTRTSATLAPFSERTIDGQLLDLTPMVGRDVLLISFWATWCTPCKGEMPTLQRLHDTLSSDGLRIVSIALDGPDTAAEVRPFIRSQGFTFPVLIDQHGDFTQTLNPTATAPFTLLVDRHGRIVRRFAGFQPSEAPALEAELRALLADTTP